MNKNNNKFTWGDAVLVKKNSPKYCHPTAFASICGIDKILSGEEAKNLKCKIDDWIYTIEFEDGSSIEVPECYLEPYKE